MEEAIRRQYPEDKDKCKRIYQSRRTPFDSDITRIKGSETFKVSATKTQVHHVAYLSTKLPVNRLTHTIIVADYAKGFAGEMGLRADATEAIQLSHDLGHLPFGHIISALINSIINELNQSNPQINLEKFDHDLQGHRIVTEFEYWSPDFKGLNLTFLVRNAFLNGAKKVGDDSREGFSNHYPNCFLTLEEQVCELFDKFWLSHDLEDILKFHMLTINELISCPDCPTKLRKILLAAILSQKTHPKDIARMVYNLILEGIYKNAAKLWKDPNFQKILSKARDNHLFILTNIPLITAGSVTKDFDDMIRFMHKHVYSNPKITGSRDEKAKNMIRMIYRFLFTEDDTLQIERIEFLNGGRIKLDLTSLEEKITAFIDLLSISTEQYLIDFFRKYLFY